MSPDFNELQKIIASLLFASDRRLSALEIANIIKEKSDMKLEAGDVDKAVTNLQKQFTQLAIDLNHTPNGYRLQTQKEYAAWISSLWKEKSPVYSKALLETLALIAYRQPITRGEIEHIRGVSVSGHIVRTLLERKWIRIIGHRQVPGNPALYGTTRDFLDYFNLSNLSDLPSLPELKSVAELDQAMQQLINESQSNDNKEETQKNKSLH